MTIHPGDPRERFRVRRRLLQGLGGLLLLPTQGFFLLIALRTQAPLAWVGWLLVLALLIVATTVWMRDRRWSDLTSRPWMPGPLVLVEVPLLVLGLLLREALPA